MIELEDIVPRRDYKLLVDWTCSKCRRTTKMIGCILPNEPLYNKHDEYNRLSLVSWEDILHKSCLCGNIEKPTRRCSRCDQLHNFDAFGCRDCDDRIKQILTLEEDYAEFKERIRKLKRKKEDATELEYELRQIALKLDELDVIPCTQCGIIWINEGENSCKECIDNAK